MNVYYEENLEWISKYKGEISKFFRWIHVAPGITSLPNYHFVTFRVRCNFGLFEMNIAVLTFAGKTEYFSPSLQEIHIHAAGRLKQDPWASWHGGRFSKPFRHLHLSPVHSCWRTGNQPDGCRHRHLLRLWLEPYRRPAGTYTKKYFYIFCVEIATLLHYTLLAGYG